MCWKLGIMPKTTSNSLDNLKNMMTHMLDLDFYLKLYVRAIFKSKRIIDHVNPHLDPFKIGFGQLFNGFTYEDNMLTTNTISS